MESSRCFSYVLREVARLLCIKWPAEGPRARGQASSTSVYGLFNQVLTFSEFLYLTGGELKRVQRKRLNMLKDCFEF